MIKNLTICIPTHCIKTETKGQYTGIQQRIPSAPSSKMIEAILIDLFNKTNLTQDINILIGFDKRKNRQIDHEYEVNLNNLKQIYSNLEIIINESETHDPIVTAPINFTKLIDAVKTKYYLFWEHDWIFTENINIESILDEMNNNNEINLIRFNQAANNNIAITQIPEQFKHKNPSNKIPLILTTKWSNNPYICRTEIFQKWWKTFVYPTDEEGGFVEGPLNVFFKYYIEKQGLEVALNTFKCFIYGKWNDEASVTHLNGYRII